MEPNFFTNKFLKSFITFVVLGGALVIAVPKKDLVLYANENLTSPGLDVFFKYVTHLGDGLMYVGLLIAALFIRYYWVAFVAVTTVVQTVLVHIFKQWIYKDLPRPANVLADMELHKVSGVSINQFGTFPSGHTATAFSVFFILTLWLGNKSQWGLLFFLCALFVALSRVYLLQHFFVDVYFGAIFGVMAVLISKWILKKKDHPIEGQSGWNRNIKSLFR